MTPLERAREREEILDQAANLDTVEGYATVRAVLHLAELVELVLEALEEPTRAAIARSQTGPR